MMYEKLEQKILASSVEKLGIEEAEESYKGFTFCMEKNTKEIICLLEEEKQY